MGGRGNMLAWLVLIKCLGAVRAERELVVISVATNQTDGYKRFYRLSGKWERCGRVGI